MHGTGGQKMANDKLISASALANVIRDDAYIHGRAYARVKQHIDDAAAVVEVAHGHKVVRERHRGVARYIPCPCCFSAIPANKPYIEKVEYCSLCGKKLDDTFQNYCPNCGADMRGTEDEE
jgi:hypothetical protein